MKLFALVLTGWLVIMALWVASNRAYDAELERDVEVARYNLGE
jgi:hypothetical protein